MIAEQHNTEFRLFSSQELHINYIKTCNLEEKKKEHGTKQKNFFHSN